nr:FAD-binding protein [uncultured Schaedlerella sp.]
MELHDATIGKRTVCVASCNTLVVGTGAAGYAAACRIYEEGQKDVLILTEGRKSGTSRNTGSDKQTYYKLNLCGDTPDSIQNMAETYFEGKGMDGDLALCEAALSTRCFYYLCEAGVAFPHNVYGEYSGYKTDHDPAMRATSAGPLTSRYMTEALEKRSVSYQIPVLDPWQVIRIFTKGERCIGVMALNRRDGRYLLVNAVNVVFAVGGPAGVYGRSVYPASQHGSTGIALEAGAAAKNLMEWQYGIASVRFRWNLSGTYQQVLPRYISTDQEENDEREFLEDYFTDPQKLLNAVFLKGYQWPFDPEKVKEKGSSMIDLLVYEETVKKRRRVYLDYTQNPRCIKMLGTDWHLALTEPVKSYLVNSHALQDTPIERLKHMNQEAVELYRTHNIDLETEYLEIGVCAQHNNGGLEGDIWWESNLKHFFPVGEANGSHGIHRPGGSALNAGQVGALRAAMKIAHRYTQPPMEEAVFLNMVKEQAEEKITLAENFMAAGKDGILPRDLIGEIGAIMSECCAHIRSKEQTEKAAKELERILKSGLPAVTAKDMPQLMQAFQVFDTLITARALTACIRNYIENKGVSRGSYLISDERGDNSFLYGNDSYADQIQIYTAKEGRENITWRPVRQIPDRELWFENVWKEYTGAFQAGD